jgi:hypothetical protein
MKKDDSVLVKYVNSGVYDVYVKDELWGRIAGDLYSKCYRQSDDRYVTQYQSRDAAVQGLLDSVEDNYK